MTKDKIAINSPIYVTTDYDQFHYIAGNRPISQPHVRELEEKIKKYGNLTPQKPLQMRWNNDRLEIVDGQHRLPALKNLKEPVYYEIKEGITLDTTRNLNSGNANWSWLDFAHSYASAEKRHFDSRAPKPYTQILELWEMSHLTFRVLLMYCGVEAPSNGKISGESGKFREGEFMLEDFALSKRLITQLMELQKINKNRTTVLATALYRFMRQPKYDHQKLCIATREYGEPLNQCYTLPDYLFALEDIYNTPLNIEG